MKMVSLDGTGSVLRHPTDWTASRGGHDALNAVKETARQFERLTANASVVSLVLHADARIAYCNNRLLALTGWRREEIEGEDWFDTFIPPPFDEMREAFAALLKNDPQIWGYENDILTRDGQPFLVRWSNSVIHSSSGEVVGTASVGRSIGIPGTGRHPSTAADSPHEIVALAQDLIDHPESAALPFVRMIAEHCAQLASDCGATAGGEAVAQHIRRAFRI